jgi:hypothetical protein
MSAHRTLGVVAAKVRLMGFVSESEDLTTLKWSTGPAGLFCRP